MSGKNIHQRLHAVMEEVDYIQKERKQGMNYTIVSHDAVTAKVRPALVKHGVIYYPVSINRTQDGNRTELDVVVRFANIDEPTDYIDVACCGYGIDNQDKGPGKATSYAVKYALLKALGLETGDDPDYDSEEHKGGSGKGSGSAGATRTAASTDNTPLDKITDPRELAKRMVALIVQAENLKALNELMLLWGEQPGKGEPKPGSLLAKLPDGGKWVGERADGRRGVLAQEPGQKAA